MNILYFDCFSGISGDMVIGALLDMGADFQAMKKELKKLNIEDEYDLKVTSVLKNGIHSTKFDCLLNKDKRVHSHDYHRTYESIKQLIIAAEFQDNITKTALAIFKEIAKAESKIHNVPLKDVHFHEVGAVDSIIDIVGTSILIHQLNIGAIYCSHIPLGTGKIKIDHGIYPVPAPATLAILKKMPVEKSTLKGELTTPTGAAIAKVLTDEFSKSMPAMIVKHIGYGAGTKTFSNHPNVLRVVKGSKP